MMYGKFPVFNLSILMVLAALSLTGCETTDPPYILYEKDRQQFNNQNVSVELGMTTEQVREILTLGEFTRQGTAVANGSVISEWELEAKIWGFKRPLDGTRGGSVDYHWRYYYFLDDELMDISTSRLRYRERAADLVIEWRNR